MRKLFYLSLTLAIFMVFTRANAQGSAQVGTLSDQNLAVIYPDSLKRESAKRALELVKNFLLSKAASGVDTGVLKKELKITRLSDYLLNMQEPDWTIINR